MFLTYKLIPSNPAPIPTWSTPATPRMCSMWAKQEREKTVVVAVEK